MPYWFKWGCSKCDLTLPTGWGYQYYVINDKGERMLCLHPSECEEAEKVLGKEPSLRLIFDRTGFLSDCICLDCWYQFKADYGSTCWYYHPYQVFTVGFKHHLLTHPRDLRVCPHCRSKRVKTVLELAGKRCPKCKEGVFDGITTGLVS